MNRVLLITTALFLSATAAAAQTEGRIGIGASVTWMSPTDGEIGSLVGGGPLVRLNPRRGWGPAGAFNWFRADIDDPSGAAGRFARLRVRPLMAGVAYTVGNEQVLTSFSLVAGPSFNRVNFHDGFLAGLPPGAQTPAIDVENSIAIRPGVNVTWTVAPRVAIVGFGGYFVSRPDFVYRDTAGTEIRNRWKADAVVLSVGAVYSIF